MVLGDVQQVEVVGLEFHIRRLVDLKAHLGENTIELAQRLGREMQVPRNHRAPRQRDINGLIGQLTR